MGLKSWAPKGISSTSSSPRGPTSGWIPGEERLKTASGCRWRLSAVCAGQESRRDLIDPLESAGLKVHVIGGADLARELDAQRAIDQGCRLAAIL